MNLEAILENNNLENLNEINNSKNNENKIINNIDDNFNISNNMAIEKNQNKFLESTLGKTINSAIDVGLKFVLPDLIENQIIDIKNTLLNQGLKEGINKAVENVIDFGKSAAGIITGDFKNISQIQTAVKKGGIIDEVSNTIDFCLKKSVENNLISKNTQKLITQGKNVILNNVQKNIEDTLTSQIKSLEKLSNYSDNWNQFYTKKDFDNMDKEYKKIQKELKQLIPLEETIKKAREIQNLHEYIKNNGKNFELSEQAIELSKKLA